MTNSKYINSLIVLATNLLSDKVCNYFRISDIRVKSGVSRTLCIHNGISCGQCIFNKNNLKGVHSTLDALSKQNE